MSLSRPSFRPTYANVVATLALMIAVVGFAGGPQAVASAVKKLAPNSVATKNIKNNAVTGVKVKDGSLGGADIKDGSLGGADIADRSLGGQDIADGSLGGADVHDGSLGWADLKQHDLVDQNFADGSVNSRVIRDDSIGTDDISGETIKGGTRAELLTLGIDPKLVGDIAPKTITTGNLAQSAIDFLTDRWSGNEISAGSTVKGFASVGYNARPNDQSLPEKRALSVSFPSPVTGIYDVQQGSPSNANCTGTFADPTSSNGVACYYVRDPGAGNAHGANVGTFDKLDQSNFGFVLGYAPTTLGWTFAQISWAFTRPAS